MLLKKLALTIFLLLCFYSLGFAQNPSPQDDGSTIKVDTELIQLDVVVTDKNGHIVDNLKKEDFEILEANKKQDISFFSLVRPQSSQDTTITTKNPVNPAKKTDIDVPLIEKGGRIFVLLVDDLHISPSNMINIKKQLLNLATNEFQDGDRVAVVTTGGGLGFLQQLTDERLVVRKALEKLVSHRHSAADPGDPAMVTEFQAQKINDGEIAPLDLAVANFYRNTQQPIPKEQVKDMIKTTSKQIVENLSFQTTATLNTIKNAILALKTVPGRKTMILVSDGFFLENREDDHFAQMRRIVDSATKSGVVIYSLGSTGLAVGGENDPFSAAYSGTPDSNGDALSLSSRELPASVIGLQSLAQDTGGFSFINSNNLLGGLKNIVSESSSYYLLAYYPENSQRDGNFREIKINIRGEKKLVVKTSKGYFAGEEKLSPKDLAKKEKLEKEKTEKAEKAEKTEKEKRNNPVDPVSSALISSVSSVLPVTDINLKMKADFLGLVNDNKASKDMGDNTVFSFAIDLRNIDFNKSADKYSNKLTALFIVIGEDGKIAHSSTNTVDVAFNDTQYAQFGKSWFFYARTLSLKPGFYNVRFAVRDPLNNRLGSVAGWVEVPNLEKSKMVLSNILLLHEEHNNKSVEKDSLSITGTGQAVSVFSEKSSIGFLCYIFNAIKAEKLTAQVEVLQSNKALFTSPQLDVVEKADSFGRITYSGKLPLAGFPFGRYRLRITINDSKNKIQAVQEQNFSIEQ